MIPRLKPVIGWEELTAALAPSTLGDVERFEKAFAKLMGQKEAVAFPYGRTGLALLLEAMGLKGREIICPAYTCVVVPHAIVTSGNEPVFIDSRVDDFNMDLDLAMETITEKTGAIIATSIFGYPVDLDKLRLIKERHPHVHIIQDCAHSFRAEWKGRPVNVEGEAAIFGLNISKLMTSIFGGMVTTDNEELAERLRRMRVDRLNAPGFVKATARRFYLAAIYATFSGPVYGFTNWLERSGALGKFVKYYDDAVIDMPDDYLTGLTGVEARVGIVQTKKYEAIVETRRRAAKFYNERLRGIGGLTLPPLVDGATYSHYVPLTTRRDELLNHALRSGVQLGWLIEYSIPEMAAYKNRVGSRFPCPVAGRYAKTSVNLPVWMDDETRLSKVADAVADFFAER